MKSILTSNFPLFTTIFLYCFLLFSETRAQKSSGLVAFYPLNGNANDESGHGNNGKLTNVNPIQNRDDETGQACQFLGTNSGYIAIPHSPSNSLNDQMTLAMWFYFAPQQSSSFYTLLEKTNPQFDGHSRYGMWVYNGGVIEVCVEPDTCPNSLCQRCLDASEKLTENQWHHVAGTYNGSSLKVYIDGKLSSERSYTSSSGISQTEFEIFMGTDLYGGTQFLTGRLDDVRIYRTALNASAIQSLYLGEEVKEEEENILTVTDSDPFSIYPTYLSKQGIINIESGSNIEEVVLFTASGKLLVRKSRISNQHIDLSNYSLDTGLYLLKVMIGNTVHLKKILLK